MRLEPLEERRLLATIYVDLSAIGANNGETWTDAYTDLQSALTRAISGDEIWVAEGTYKPTSGSDRTVSFGLKTGVDVYGGFAGGETDPDQRDLMSHVTTLSGDIGMEGNKGDNSYHVLCASGVTDATLHGLTITGGNASVASGNYYLGGGMFNDGSSPTLTNVTFSGNSATYGGGMFNDGSSPTLTNVTFSGNSASAWGGGMDNFDYSSPTLTNVTFRTNSAEYGGGMYNSRYSSPRLTNVTFIDNSASYNGGGMSNSSSSPTLTNVTFSGNSASYGGGGGGGMENYYSSPRLVNVTFNGNSAFRGGGMFNTRYSFPTLTNSILWGDTASGGSPEIYNDSVCTTTVTFSIVQGGWAGTGNLDEDPLFVDAAGGDLHLQPGSPAIDAGDNTAVPADVADLDGDGDTTEPTPLDLDLLPRFVGTALIVDMGAYEFQNRNSPPVASDQSVTADEDTPEPITLIATDPDDDGLMFSIVSDPSHGTLTDFDEATGAVVYTPEADYHGSDSFSFKANDGTTDSNIATVSITVDAVADIVADSAEVKEDIAKSITVLANDNFEDPGAYVSGVTDGAHGTVAINAAGTVTYTPALDFHGTDSFTYTVTTHLAGPTNTETATVSVTVLSAQGQIAAIVEQVWTWVDEGLISRGQGNALKSKLNGAIAQLDNGKITPAVNMLKAFENQIRALVRSRQVSAEDGDAAVAAAEGAIHSASVRAAKVTDAAFAALGKSKKTGSSLAHILLEQLVSVASSKLAKGRK